MKLDKLPRMTEWIIITILLTILIYLFSPQQLPVSLYKLSLIAMAAVVGYWIDRSLFPYARPDQFQIGTDNPAFPGMDAEKLRLIIVFSVSMLRRAIIVGTAMLAVSLGV